MSSPALIHFKPHEFRGQIEIISPRLLVMLDVFRFMWDRKVYISAHPNAIGRTTGTSRHNYKRYGEVQAIDVMPEGILDQDDAELAVEIAQTIGFTGIGYYPHWDVDGDPTNGLAPGLHLDVRTSSSPSRPDTWGGVKAIGQMPRPENEQVYVGLTTALEQTITHP